MALAVTRREGGPDSQSRLQGACDCRDCCPCRPPSSGVPFREPRSVPAAARPGQRRGPLGPAGGGPSPSLPRRPLLPATLLRAVGGSRAGPVGALHAGRGTRLPLGAASPLSPAGWSGGVDALCSAGAVVSGPGDTHTQRQRGRSHPKCEGAKESVESPRTACSS